MSHATISLTEYATTFETPGDVQNFFATLAVLGSVSTDATYAIARIDTTGADLYDLAIATMKTANDLGAVFGEPVLIMKPDERGTVKVAYPHQVQAFFSTLTGAAGVDFDPRNPQQVTLSISATDEWDLFETVNSIETDLACEGMYVSLARPTQINREPALTHFVTTTPERSPVMSSTAEPTFATKAITAANAYPWPVTQVLPEPLCATDPNPDAWFPVGQEPYDHARATCGSCGLAALCRTVAATRGEYGVWGGVLFANGHEVPLVVSTVPEVTRIDPDRAA